MAEKQAGGLSLRIGLTLNQLQSDFLAAEQTVKQGIAALNRQQNIIRLKMETDTAVLDALTEKTKIFEVQERAITQLLAMQRDKLTLATKAYQDYANSKNANAVVTKNLETSMERERLAVARLEAQLKSLSAQQVIINTTKLQDSIAQLNSKIQHVKIQAELDVSKLQGANAAFDAQKIHIAAVTKEIELQRQKLVQLQETMYRSAKLNGGDSAQTLTFKTNVLQQIQEIQKLENKLKELQNTKVDLQIRADTFRQAESQIHEKISLLNAKLEHIKVKTDIDLSSLSPMASEFDKAKAHVHNLNQELTLQNQKLAEMKKLLSAFISANGLNNVKTINLQTEIQKQIQAIDKLKAKINELNKIQPPKNNNLLSGYLNIKGDVVGKLNEISTAFSNLKGATASADSAITSSLSVIGSIPHPVGRAVAALAALPLVLKGVENSLVDMSKAAAAAGDSVYVMSRGFQMSVADTGKFTAMCKTAGVEVNDLASTIKRTQQQIIRGGDTSKAEQWLKRYGESAFDASGHLKDLNAMTLTLSRALKKAQAEGNGMAFVLATMRNASADAITAIEDAEDVYKQAAGLVKNGLLDPKFAHEVQGNINAMNLQAGYMNAAFSSALLPVANEIVPLLTERMGKLTQVIADNKEIIKDFGLTAAEVFKFIEGLAEGAAIAVGSVVKSMHEFTTEKKKSTVEIFLDDEDVKDVESLMKKDLLRQGLDRELKMVEANRELYKRTYAYYEPMFKAIEDRRKELERKNEELKKELEKQLTSVADLSSVAADRLKVEKNPDLLKEAESLKKILQEASDIQYKLSHTDYENKKLDLLQQQQDMLNQAEMTSEKREAIEKLGAAKLLQIEQEHADKLKEIRANVEAADKTALQNKLDTIEKERQVWIKAGMDEVEAVELAQKRKAKAYEEANAKIQEHLKNAANIEFELTHSAFEKQMRDIEQWRDAQAKKAESAEETAAIIAEAAAKEAQAFESEMDRIKGTLQSLDDKIFEQEHSQYENDIRRIQQERIKLYEDYQSKGILNADTQALIERYYQNAVGKLNKRAAESRAKDGDYTKAPEGAMQSGGNGIMVIGADQIIDDGLIRGQQQTIGLLTDENRIRSMLLPKLNAEAREAVERIQSLKELTAVQKDLVQASSGFQLIEGDKVTNTPQSFEQISGDQIILPTQELQQFGDKIQETTSELEPLQKLTESAQGAADAQKSLAESTKLFPPEYLKNLADSAKSVSETQLLLTKSTLDLIEAQKDLAKAFENLPKVNPAQETKNNQPADGFLKLATSTQDVRQAQDLLASSARDANASLREISDIPPPKQSNEGFIAPKLGFDWDSFSGISQTGLQALSLLYSIGGIAPHPAAKAGALILGGAIGAGFGFGGYKEDSVHEQFAMSNEVDLSALETSLKGIDEKIQGVQRAMEDKASLDFSELTTPLNAIDENTQRILQAMQDEQPHEADQLQELFGTLPNIEEYTKSILLELQDKAAMDLSEIITPLTAIDENVQNMLQRMSEVQAMPSTPETQNAELADYMTPLTSIDTNVQSLLQQLQTPTAPEGATDYLTPLNNIDGKIQSVLLEMQSRQPVTLETVVTPLNNIEQVLGNIATALSNQQPPQINISPNNNVNLGGAYVFDNALKQELVNDITSQIVDKITAAVQQATSRSSFGYGS